MWTTEAIRVLNKNRCPACGSRHYWKSIGTAIYQTNSGDWIAQRVVECWCNCGYRWPMD